MTIGTSVAAGSALSTSSALSALTALAAISAFVVAAKATLTEVSHVHTLQGGR